MNTQQVQPLGAAYFITASALALVLGLLVYFLLPAYRTFAMMFFGMAAVAALYLVLPGAFKIALVVALCLGFVLFLAAEWPVVAASQGDGEVEADYVIVLGAAVYGTEPSPTLRNRLGTALGYLESHPQSVAIVSGGQGKGEAVTEAEAMSRWLLDHGVAPERILKEERSTSTWENMVNSFALIGDRPSAKVAVVSNEYHIYRARIMAASLGHSVAGIPAQTARPLLMVNYFIREALCVVHFWIFGN